MSTEPSSSPSLVQKLRDALSHGTLLRAMVQGFMTVAALTLLAKAVSFLIAHGYAKAVSLDGGLLAWNALPK